MDNTPESTLTICRSLFDDFHEHDIRYCHWKSNEHLGAGLAGTTDIDVIVDPREDISSLLADAGFKRFEPSWFIHYPGLEDYLGYDERTGRLVHLHLHHRLAIGNERLKDYHLPWVDRMLKRRVFDEEHGVYTTDPEMEMVLLLVRYALKLRKRDYVTSLTGGYLDEDIVREYEWLRSRVDTEDVERLAEQLLNEEAARIIRSMLVARPGLWQFRRLRSVCTSELSIYRTYGYVEAQLRGFFREVGLGLRSINDRFLGQPRMARRTIPSGGFQVVLLGVDGAGKSTLAEELEKWLGWKIDVEQIYYGSGDGDATRLRYPILLARERLDAGTNGPGDPNSDTDRSLFMRVGRLLRGLLLARERKKKLRRGWRAKNRGFVVLGDRYPQNQIEGFTDGPLLTYLTGSSSSLLRHLADRERRVYQSAANHPPDLVIKLALSPETARERKPEMPLDQLERRVAAIEGLEFDTDVVVVDAEQPLEDVLRAVKRHIWERL